MEKIDFHVHVTPPEISARPQRYAEREPYFAALFRNARPGKARAGFAAAEDVVSMLDGSGFDRAVVFGFAFRDPGLCRAANDYVIEAARRFPERLCGFMVVSPAAPGAEREIARCHDAGLKGVGELFPAGQGFDIAERRDTGGVTGACAERNLPVMVHVNEPVGHRYPGKTDVGLRQIERFVENSPGLRVVLAHWGGGLPFYEAMPELRKKFRNVFYDTAASPFLYDQSVYRAALALGLGGKIVFGSDFPLLPPSRYMPHLETLPECERALILGGTAGRLLSAENPAAP